MIQHSHFGDLALGRGSFGFRHGIREWLSGITVYRNGNREHWLRSGTSAHATSAILCRMATKKSLGGAYAPKFAQASGSALTHAHPRSPTQHTYKLFRIIPMRAACRSPARARRRSHPRLALLRPAPGPAHADLAATANSHGGVRCTCPKIDRVDQIVLEEMSMETSPWGVGIGLVGKS